MPETILGEVDQGEQGSEDKVEGSTTLTAGENKEGEGKEGENKENKEGEGKEGENKGSENTDGKPKDGKADEGKDGAPEAYQDFTLPEGMDFNKEAFGEIEPLLKDMDASQAQAQKLIDVHAKMVQQQQEFAVKSWADTQAKWVETGEADEEFGKKNYDASISIAKSAIREIGGAPLMKALEETGMGNHPEFIRFFYRVGTHLGEDKFQFGNKTPDAAKTQASRIFGKHQVPAN